MSVIAHQALFGERQRGHGLIAASADAPAPILKTLEGTTDLPPAPPANVPWLAYYSGYSVQGWYVVSRTAPDPGAARGGMVLTHALLLPPGVIGRLTRLRSLLDAIPEKPTRTTHLDPVALDLEEQPSASQSQEPPGLAALVHHLVNRGADTPVGWVGAAGFEEALVALWANLWPEARASLDFRLSFRPVDLGPQPPTLVLVPEQATQLYWRGMRLVRPDDTHAATTGAEAFLLGRPEADPLRSLLEESGAQMHRVEDVRILERASARLGCVDGGTTEEVRALARLLAKLSPEPDRGASLKGRILDVLAAGVTAGEADGIAALENFDASAFPGGAEAMRQAMDSWVEVAVSAADGSRPTAEVIARAMETNVEGWSGPLSDAVRTRVRAWTPRLPEVLWGWWSERPDLVAHVSASLPATAPAAEDLARACPTKIPLPTGAAVRSMAATRGWMALHAAAAVAAMRPQEAVDLHLLHDPASGGQDGIRVLAQRLAPLELVRAAVRVGDPRLIEHAGEACASDPGLRRRLDVTQPTWRAVWLASIRSGLDPWAGVTDPPSVMAQVFDAVLVGEPVDEALLAALADTAAANAASYPQRAELWGRLPQLAYDAVLSRTADGWLELFPDDPAAASDLEPALRARIEEPMRVERHLLSPRYADAATGAALVEALHLSEDLFLTWLHALLQQARVPLSTAASERLGDLVLRRSWKPAAARLAARLLDGRRDLGGAVDRCAVLLGFFDRLRLAASGLLHRGVADDDWWSALMDIAAQLYPLGPTERGLWARAKGAPADLDDAGNGRDRWRRALAFLRQGGGQSKITRRTLLAEMLIDYSGNNEVRLLNEWVKDT